ncbi:MAG: YceI family protein, partial [Sinomicrobium sp.]|nr:YceI family protein [Sinomicrobium sp.]
MKTMRLYFSCVIYLFILGNLWGQTHYLAENGRMHFKSDAPLELIEATSAELKGVLDTEKGSFAFSVDIPTFQGFNSPLQREHFNENYLESKRYPRATFVGKIIEEVDFFAPGSYEVRAKGVLDVHGVKQERIIKGQLNVTKDGISI